MDIYVKPDTITIHDIDTLSIEKTVVNKSIPFMQKVGWVGAGVLIALVIFVFIRRSR